MHKIAMILGDSVVNVAVWDLTDPWNPVDGVSCDTTVDLGTDAAGVDIGWSYTGPTGVLATGGSFAPPSA